MKCLDRSLLCTIKLILLLTAGCGPAAREPATAVKPDHVTHRSTDEAKGEAHFYGNVVALCIGIGDVDGAKPDAEAFAEICKEGYGYEVDLLVGEEPTRSVIVARLDRYARELGQEDALIIYFAGHGRVFNVKDPNEYVPTQVGFLVPYGARLDLEVTADVSRWEMEAINMRGLLDRVEKMNCRHVVLIADACCSGFMTKRGIDSKQEIFSLLADESRCVLAATRQHEKAEGGVFTPELVGLLHRFEQDREVASVTDLFCELRPVVKERSRGEMIPRMGRIGEGDGEFIFFPLSIKRESIEPVKEKVVEKRELDQKALAVVGGVIDRAKDRAARRTSLHEVIKVAAAPSYWYGESPDEKAKDWRAVRGGFHENAAWGESLAMAGLHFCYARGIGEDKPKEDLDQAYHWAGMAAQIEESSGIGEYLLGRCYRHGIGVSKNEVAADELFRTSSGKGCVLADCVVAEFIMGGKPSKQQAERARTLIEKASQAGVPWATRLLADWLVTGERPGISRDVGKGVKLYELAASQGSVEALHSLSKAYSEGKPEFPPKDTDRASDFLEEAAAKGLAAAQHNLAVELLYPPGRLGLLKDAAKSRRLLELAAAQDYGQSLVKLAVLYAEGKEPGFEVDHEKAREYVERAAALGEPEALYLQGIWQNGGGDGSDIDTRGAFECFRRAAELGHPEACYKVAEMYLDGKAVETSKPFYLKRKTSQMPYVVPFHSHTHHALHWYCRALQPRGGSDEWQAFPEARRIVGEFSSALIDKQGAAVSTMKRWKHEFPETANDFKKLLQKNQ